MLNEFSEIDMSVACDEKSEWLPKWLRRPIQTDEAYAERMGISRIECGGNVSIDTLVRYATACGGKLKGQVV